jgi:hypothetical protein
MTPLVEPYLTVLKAATFSIASEADLQRQVADVFTRAGIQYERERVLSCKRNRIDFFLRRFDQGTRSPIGAVGLELKVGQTSKQILEQLLRYAAEPQLDELIVASTSHTALRLPQEVRGKRLHSIQLRAWC